MAGAFDQLSISVEIRGFLDRFHSGHRTRAPSRPHAAIAHG
jgi:hypothetical protein